MLVQNLLDIVDEAAQLQIWTVSFDSIVKVFTGTSGEMQSQLKTAKLGLEKIISLESDGDDSFVVQV